MSSNEMIAVHARFVARPSHGENLVAAVRDMFDTAAGEPGTIAYAVHRDRDDPDIVVMYELYRSDEALEEHGRSETAVRFGARLEELLDREPEAWFTRPVLALGLDPGTMIDHS